MPFHSTFERFLGFNWLGCFNGSTKTWPGKSVGFFYTMGRSKFEPGISLEDVHTSDRTH